MDNFFNTYDKIQTKCKKLTSGEDIEYCMSTTQRNILEQYGTFLNNIPSKYLEKVAEEIFWMIYDYNIGVLMDNLSFNFANAKHENTENLYRQGFEESSEIRNMAKRRINKEKKKDSDSAYKNRIGDLKAAKNLRERLESFDEMFRNVDEEALSLLDEVKKEPYFKMIELIDTFIQALENKSYSNGFHVLEKKYVNIPKIRGKNWIIDKLSKIINPYKVTTNQAIDILASQLYNS